MTIKRKRKIYKRKLLRRITNIFANQIINGMSIEETTELIPQGLLKDIRGGGINDR